MYGIRRFVKHVKDQGDFTGCYYKRLSGKYALVFAWCETTSGAEGASSGYSLCGKIAENCDDLQCDYDFDWQMPEVDGAEGGVVDTEICGCETLDALTIAETFEKIYEDLTR